MELDRAIQLLIEIKTDSVNRKKNVFRFKSDMWKEPEAVLTPAIEEILGDLVYDFGFYVDNPEWRWQDASFYGPEKLIRMIDEAFVKLKGLGVEIPKH